MSLPATEPYYRHAVGYNKACRIENLLEMGVSVGLHNTVHSCYGYVTSRFMVPNPVRHAGHDLGNLNRMNADAQYPEVDRVFRPSYQVDAMHSLLSHVRIWP